MSNIVNAINLLTKAIKTVILTFTQINNETPAGTIDGSNVTFTLAKSPDPSASVQLFLNGMYMAVTEDYTISGLTITFLLAPSTGSILRAFYRY